MTRLLALLLALIWAAPALAQDFPLTLDHRFGQTVIEAPPQRVASLDFAGGDDLLALGVQPVTLRQWFGEGPRGVWPWAEPLLQEDPVLLRGTLDFERIAATRPDVILAFWSGISQADYDKLSQIAPVVAAPAGGGDFDLTWDARALLAGRVLGRETEARARIAAIGARLAAVAAAHPGWQDRSVSLAYNWDGTPGAFVEPDIRARLLAQMGLQAPAALRAMATPGAFSVALSPEDLSPLEADLILWIGPDGNFDRVQAMPARRFLQAARDGRELFPDAETVAALSWSSLLSLPHAIDRLVPMIEEILP